MMDGFRVRGEKIHQALEAEKGLIWIRAQMCFALLPAGKCPFSCFRRLLAPFLSLAGWFHSDALRFDVKEPFHTWRWCKIHICLSVCAGELGPSAAATSLHLHITSPCFNTAENWTVLLCIILIIYLWWKCHAALFFPHFLFWPLIKTLYIMYTLSPVWNWIKSGPTFLVVLLPSYC